MRLLSWCFRVLFKPLLMSLACGKACGFGPVMMNLNETKSAIFVSWVLSLCLKALTIQRRYKEQKDERNAKSSGPEVIKLQTKSCSPQLSVTSLLKSAEHDIFPAH